LTIISPASNVACDRIFLRYDNAPHHPEIATHPHHKHLGAQDRLTPTDQPTLNQILIEIEDWLGA
jgi:hypothetical protein